MCHILKNCIASPLQNYSPFYKKEKKILDVYPEILRAKPISKQHTVIADWQTVNRFTINEIAGTK